MNLDCLILAAGSSSRFGRCKLLADWGGTPLVHRAVAAARTLRGARVTLVTGAFHQDLVRAITPSYPDVTVIRCATWQNGMGESLAFGIRQLPHPNPVLVLLADTPLVESADLQSLHKAWHEGPHRIVCAGFEGTRSVPALFPPEFKPRLARLTGDRGAKYLLDAQVRTLPMPNAGHDIDTHADLIHLTRRYHHDIA